MDQTIYAYDIHAPDITPRVRHIRIMRLFDKLESGKVMHLSNDHDPKPLYYQFMFERENQFTWIYLEEGPELWRVEIWKR